MAYIFRAQFSSSKDAVIKFMTEADLTAFSLTVAADGLTVTCGNDRTKVEDHIICTNKNNIRMTRWSNLMIK